MTRYITSEEISNLTVRKIKHKDGKSFIIKWHYSKGVGNVVEMYGLFLKEELVGVCAFGTPCSEAVCASVFGTELKRSVKEIQRFCLTDDMPKNSESWFISRALKQYKEDRPDILAVLTFADATENHNGIIYQSTNALYCGTSGKATFYMDTDGRLHHPRQNGVNITKQMASEKMWKPVKREGKHRYLYLLPSDKRDKKRLLKLLKLAPSPYPKLAGQTVDRL